MILACGCDTQSADNLCHKARTIRGASHRWYREYVASITALYPTRTDGDITLYNYHVELQNALYEHMGLLPVHK